ncbi:MAG: hypothetical protein RI973_1264 [Bacteroidota bacterium]
MRLLILISAILLWLSACQQEDKAQATAAEASAKPIPVRTAPIERQRVQLAIHTAGQVSSQTEVKPSFKIGGVISRTFADEGDRVRKGQVLATLDLTEINAQVRQAEEALDKADRDLKRVRNLHADSVATLENLQNATTALRLAQEQLQVAKFNQQYAEIRSPVSGKVVKKILNTGEVAAPGMPVYYLLGDNPGDWVVKAGVSDYDWARLKVGDRATLEFDAWPSRSFAARVSQLATAGNPASGTFDVELELLEQPGRLAAGLIASVAIFPQSEGEQVVVPLDALVEVNKQDALVYTVEQGKAKAIPIKIAQLFDDKVVVSSGLESVTRLVTVGAPYLADGAQVKEE